MSEHASEPFTSRLAALVAAVRLGPAAVAMVAGLLVDVAENPDDPSERATLARLARLGLDTDRPGLAAAAGVTCFLFVLTLAGVAWVVVVACDEALPAADEGPAYGRGFLRLLLRIVGWSALLGSLAAFATMILTFREDIVDTRWTIWLVIGSGVAMAASTAAARRSVS